MDLFKMNLWRGGFFKQAKYLVSTPQQSQKCMYISEPGTVSFEYLPMQTGFVTAKEVKKSWNSIHCLKFNIEKNSEVQDEAVLVISDRSRIPLDPLDTLKTNVKEKIGSLKDIARIKHADERSSVGVGTSSYMRLMTLIINGCFVMLGIFALVTFLKGCG